MRKLMIPGLPGTASVTEAFAAIRRLYTANPKFAVMLSLHVTQAWRAGELVLPGLNRPAREGVEVFVAELVAANTGLPRETALAWARAGLTRANATDPRPRRVQLPVLAGASAGRTVVYAADPVTGTRRWRRLLKGETPPPGDLNSAWFGSVFGTQSTPHLVAEVVSGEEDTSRDRVEGDWAHAVERPTPAITRVDAERPTRRVRDGRGVWRTETREIRIPLDNATRNDLNAAATQGYGDTITDAMIATGNPQPWEVVRFGDVAFYARVLPANEWLQKGHRWATHGSTPWKPRAATPPATRTPAAPAAPAIVTDPWRHSSEQKFQEAASKLGGEFAAAHAAHEAERKAAKAYEAAVDALLEAVPAKERSAAEVLELFPDPETAKAVLGLEEFNVLTAAARGQNEARLRRNSGCAPRLAW